MRKADASPPSPFLSKDKGYTHIIGKNIYQRRLNYQYQRDTYHEFRMAGLVPDNQHCKQHGGGAADHRQGDKRAFPYPAGRAAFRRPFVVNCDNNGYKRYQRKVRRRYQEWQSAGNSDRHFTAFWDSCPSARQCG